jgi:hypothetical protein
MSNDKYPSIASFAGHVVHACIPWLHSFMINYVVVLWELVVWVVKL